MKRANPNEVNNAPDTINRRLSQIHTTVEQNGVKVTINAEPRILEINIPGQRDTEKLSSIIQECLNAAFSRSRKQVLDFAIAELDRI